MSSIRTTAWRMARLLIAFGIAAGSFAAVRQLFHGWCLFPVYDYDTWSLFLFYSLPVAFFVGFVWLVSKLASPLILARGVSPPQSRLLAVALGVNLYALVALVGYSLIPPVSRGDVGDSEGFSPLIWTFWVWGFLFHSGNFSYYSCGY